jgi:hypothetical protein
MFKHIFMKKCISIDLRGTGTFTVHLKVSNVTSHTGILDQSASYCFITKRIIDMSSRCVRNMTCYSYNKLRKDAQTFRAQLELAKPCGHK